MVYFAGGGVVSSTAAVSPTTIVAKMALTKAVRSIVGVRLNTSLGDGLLCWGADAISR